MDDPTSSWRPDYRSSLVSVQRAKKTYTPKFLITGDTPLLSLKGGFGVINCPQTRRRVDRHTYTHTYLYMNTNLLFL